MTSLLQSPEDSLESFSKQVFSVDRASHLLSLVSLVQRRCLPVLAERYQKTSEKCGTKVFFLCFPWFFLWFFCWCLGFPKVFKGFCHFWGSSANPSFPFHLESFGKEKDVLIDCFM